MTARSRIAAARITGATLALAMLAGCGIFKGGGDKGPKTPVVGERIAVLTSDSDAAIDPALAGTPVTLPDPVVNPGWEQPGGNAAKSMGQLALAATPSEVWTARVAATSAKVRLGASPVVGDGGLYVIDTTGTVHAFDAKTGAARWATTVRGKARAGRGGNGFLGLGAGKADDANRAIFGGGVSFADGKLYATTGLGDVARLDAASGKIDWDVRPGGPLRGAPSIASGQIYVVSQDNQLFALKADDGSAVWNSAATLETAGVFGVAAPAVGQGTVVAGFSSGELNAYRYENGRVVWQDALSRTSISTSVSNLSDIDADPVIDSGRVYAIGEGGRMVALELVTGQRQWELNIGGISTPWIAGDWLFVVTSDAKLLCVQRVTGKVRWIAQLRQWRNAKNKNEAINWTAPVLAGGRLILASSLGQIVNVDPLTGTPGATLELKTPVYLAPVVANNMLYILDSKGRLHAWR